MTKELILYKLIHILAWIIYDHIPKQTNVTNDTYHASGQLIRFAFLSTDIVINLFVNRGAVVQRFVLCK